MHLSLGYHTLITWLSCTDHVADHALITWLLCTDHVADQHPARPCPDLPRRRQTQLRPRQPGDCQPIRVDGAQHRAPSSQGNRADRPTARRHQPPDQQASKEHPMNDTIADLRKHLFDTLRDLRAEDSPLDIERARAINDTAQVIINSAKAEIDYIRVAGGKGSGFIPADAPPLPCTTGEVRTSMVLEKPDGDIRPPLPCPTGEVRTPTGIKAVSGNVTTHRLR